MSSSDQPATPLLTASKVDPTYGDSVTLTCSSSTEGVTSYRFFKNSAPLTPTGTGNTFTIVNATEIIPGGVNYSCKAFIDSVSSEASKNLNVLGRTLIFIIIFVKCQCLDMICSITILNVEHLKRRQWHMCVLFAF